MADSNPFDRFDAPAKRAGNPFDRFDGAAARSRANRRIAEYSATDLAGSKFTMGLGDKVGAVGTALGLNLRRAVTGQPTTVGRDYDRALADELEAKAAYQEKHPVVDWATSPLNFLGAGPGKVVSGALAGAAPATIAASRSALVRSGVVSGAVTGAAAGAGNSRGSAGDQIGQVTLSSGLGAITGGATARYLPGLVDAAAKKVTPYLERLIGGGAPGRVAPPAASPRSIHASAPGRPPGATSPVSNAPTGAGPATPLPAAPLPRAPARATAPRLSRSHQILSDQLEADGTTPRAAARMIDDARRRGVPLAIMDTGDNVRGLATGVANAPGKSRTVMRDAVIARQEGQTERVQGAINRDLGPTVGTATEAQRLEDVAQATAAPLYKRAYAAGAVDSPTIKALMAHPEMQAALDAGKQIHANETFLANAKGEAAPEPLVDGFPDVRTLDYAKRALDRKIDAAYSGDAQAKSQLPFLKDLRSTLLTSLDKAVPDYAAARQAYAGPSAMKEALANGKSALNKTADDISVETRGLSPAELDHYKLGLRSALSDKIEGQADGGAKTQALVGTPKKRAALAQLFGGEQGFDNFLATLADEAKTSATYARVNAGSPTARNLADDAHLGGETTVAQSVGKAGVKAALGHHLGALTGLLGDANDRIARKASEGVRSELAAALSETDPVVLAEALRLAQRARAYDRLSARRAQPAGRVGAVAAGQGSGYVSSLLGPGR